MRTSVFAVFYLLISGLGLLQTSIAQNQIYFPPANNAQWEKRSPAELGLSDRHLQSAVSFAIEQESDRPRDQALSSALGFAREPYNQLLGPTTVRGEPTGIILRHGYIAAIWGEPYKVDMTHSITKSFLSSVAGLAYDRQLIHDLDTPVYQDVASEHFQSEHNQTITWDHLLRQTSAWEGTLWDKPDWADRPVGDDAFSWPERDVPKAGTTWKYNDVRVNVLALALLETWRQPLPSVLKQHLMDPIGASNTWRWHGYENSWVMIDGQKMQSVSGGGHWGGGMFINAFDQARFGYLTLNRGKWAGKQVFSEKWYQLATTPTPIQKTYGFMNWFLNTDKELLASAPENTITHLGAGTNMVYVDPENDLVIVARWLKREAMNELVERVIKSIQ